MRCSPASIFSTMDPKTKRPETEFAAHKREGINYGAAWRKSEMIFNIGNSSWRRRFFCRVAHDSGGDVMKTVMTFMT